MTSHINTYSDFYVLDKSIIYKMHFYLDGYSFVALKLTCNYMYFVAADNATCYEQYRKDVALSRIMKVLASIGMLHDCHQFIHMFGGVIAGSLVLRCLNDDSWSISDINLIAPKYYNNVKYTEYMPGGIGILNNMCHDPDSEGQDCTAKLIYGRTKVGCSIYTGTYISQGGIETRVRLTFINMPSAAAFLKAYCDLSLCHVYTDFENVYCYDFWQQICRVGSLLKKNRMFTPQTMRKYLERGFTIKGRLVRM